MSVNELDVLKRRSKIPYIKYQKVDLIIALGPGAEIDYHGGKARSLGPFFSQL